MKHGRCSNAPVAPASQTTPPHSQPMKTVRGALCRSETVQFIWDGEDQSNVRGLVGVMRAGVLVMVPSVIHLCSGSVCLPVMQFVKWVRCPK